VNLTDWYVNEELRRMEHARDESPSGALYWRLEWLALKHPPRRPVLAWLGDRLVGMGERLQDWSMPAPRPALPE
jgi:hypothetical protein